MVESFPDDLLSIAWILESMKRRSILMARSLSISRVGALIKKARSLDGKGEFRGPCYTVWIAKR